MKKIDIKTKDTYTKNEMKRYLGVLSEDFTDKVKGLGEGLKIVIEKQDKQTKILNSHTEMIGILMEDVSVLKEDVSVLKEDVSVLKEDVSVLKEDVSVLKEDVSVLKEDVSVLKDDMQIVKKELKKKVDYDEFLSLVQRVNKLEAKN
jgi:hypothetical protein